MNRAAGMAAVAFGNDTGMRMDRRVRREETIQHGKPSGMVVVTVAQHHMVSGGRGDSDGVGVPQDRVAGSGINPDDS